MDQPPIKIPWYEDANVAAHLMKYGYSEPQALVVADPSPHERLTLGTKELAAALGFTWQTIPTSSPGWGIIAPMSFVLAFREIMTR